MLGPYLLCRVRETISQTELPYFERLRNSYYTFAVKETLPEGEDVGQHINEAMKLIEDSNEELRGVLPKNFNTMESALLADLLRTFNGIPADMNVDYFGRIYEYFLGKFAMSEGQGGGEFYTPESLVKLIVNIIEPYHGKIYDPGRGRVFKSNLYLYYRV